MRTIAKTLVVAGLLAGSTGLAQAGYIQTFTPGMATTVAGATTFDFNGGLLPTGYSGAGSVLNTSIPGVAAAPAGDNTPYLSVAYPLRAGTETFQAASGTSYNYFGLYWGSIDAYNSLDFYSGNSLLAHITGSDVIQTGTSLGDQTAVGSNRYVNFTFTDGSYDRLVFGTTQYAFESDNHAVGTVAVPEPETLGLMAAGLLALAFASRRQRFVQTGRP